MDRPARICLAGTLAMMGCVAQGDLCQEAAAHVAACLEQPAPTPKTQCTDPDQAARVLEMDCAQVKTARAAGKADNWFTLWLCESVSSGFCSEFIADNIPDTPASNVTFTIKDGSGLPEWVHSTDEDGYYGTDYAMNEVGSSALYDACNGHTLATERGKMAQTGVFWGINVLSESTYRIDVKYPAFQANTARAVYAVHSTSRTDYFTVDQRKIEPGGWHTLGTFSLDATSRVGLNPCYVRSADGHYDGILVADAVRFTEID